MDKTKSDMVTLPNGIQIPRKQYEEEFEPANIKTNN